MFFAVVFEINFTYFYYYTGFVDLQNEFWYFHEFKISWRVHFFILEN